MNITSYTSDSEVFSYWILIPPILNTSHIGFPCFLIKLKQLMVCGTCLETYKVAQERILQLLRMYFVAEKDHYINCINFLSKLDPVWSGELWNNAVEMWFSVLSIVLSTTARRKILEHETQSSALTFF